MFKFLKDFLFEEETSMPRETVGQVPQPPVEEIPEPVGGGSEPPVLNMDFTDPSLAEAAEEPAVPEAPQPPFWGEKPGEKPVVIDGDTATEAKVIDLTMAAGFQDHVDRPDETPEGDPIHLESTPALEETPDVPSPEAAGEPPVMEPAPEHIAPSENSNASLATEKPASLEKLTELSEEAEKEMTEIEELIKKLEVQMETMKDELVAYKEKRAQLEQLLSHLAEFKQKLQEIADKKAALDQEEATVTASAADELKQINKAETTDHGMAA